MGCDIHMHLEYLHPDVGGGPAYEPVIASEFYVRRYYPLFNQLAGVRGLAHDGPAFEPRGLPADVCSEIFMRYYIEVEPDDPPNDYYPLDEAETIDVKTAKAWLERDPTLTRVERLGRPFIQDADWHHASFLNLEETIATLNYSSAPGIDPAPHTVPEMRVVLQFMRTLDAEFGEGASRIVFWFDN